MDIVENVFSFKRKWMNKLIYQISSLYETPTNDLVWEKDIDEFLSDCIDSYLLDETYSDDIIKEYYLDVDEELLSKVDLNLFKLVLNTFNKPKYIISNYSFMNLVYISILLESTIDMYRLSFDRFKKDDILEVLNNNIIGLNFIRLKKKKRKINLISSYIEYITKIQIDTFGILDDDKLNLNFIRLLSENDSYIANYNLKLMELSDYDEDIVNEVKEDKEIDKKLITITYSLTRLKIELVKELQKDKINKVLFIIDNNEIDNSIIDYINNTSKIECINSKIMLVCKDISNTIGTKLDVAYYYDSVGKMKSATEYKNKTLVVNKSFWENNKRDEKRFTTNNIKFITINDNINYLFKRKEVDA